MIQQQIKITCDWCGADTVLRTGDCLEAECKARRKGWITKDVGYANSAHFCSHDCEKAHCMARTHDEATR